MNGKKKIKIKVLGSLSPFNLQNQPALLVVV